MTVYDAFGKIKSNNADGLEKTMKRYCVSLLTAVLLFALPAGAYAADQSFGQIKSNNADIQYNDATRVFDLYKLLLNTDAANALVVETAAGTDLLVVDTLVPQITIGGVLITSANIGSVGSRVPVVYATDVNATTGTIATLGSTTATIPTVYGSAASAGDLRLDSTSHGTPGLVRFGGGSADYYDEKIGLWHQTSLTFQPRKPVPLVTFMFDDGSSFGFSLMLPVVFTAQGEVACSAVITDLIGTDGYMSWANVVALQTAGWEILSHSVTHPDLTGLTESQIRAELANSKTALEAHGLVVNNFVYPYHYSNETVRRLTREYYRSARGGAQQVNPRILNQYYYCSLLSDDHTLLANYKAFVDEAETNSRWVVFYLHGTTADDVTMLNELIDYIQAKSISIVTANQALDIIGNAIDHGDNFAIGDGGIRAVFPGVTTFGDNVGIGTTAAPGYKLDVRGGAIVQEGSAASAGYMNTNVTDLASQTTLNPGLLVYGGAAASKYGMDIGYNVGNYRLRLFAGATADIGLGVQSNSPTAQSNFTELVTIKNNGNVGIGTTTFGTSGAKVLALSTSTAPTTSPADVVQIYSSDQTDGNACLHTRTENGKVIKLYEAMAHIADPTDDATTQAAVASIINGLKDMGLMAPDP